MLINLARHFFILTYQKVKVEFIACQVLPLIDSLLDTVLNLVNIILE